MGFMSSTASTGFLLLTVAGCSALALREDACASDDECASAFGEGFVCLPSGNCGEALSADDSGSETEEEEIEPVTLADSCAGDSVPMRASDDAFFSTSTLALSNTIDELACLDVRQIGHDGFFLIESIAGQRWHFHVRALDEEDDPAVYVLRSCDSRACQAGDAIDLCGAGFDEHLSFVAPTSGRFYVGIDSKNSGGVDSEVLAISPICGNGVVEHSESCDDGNTKALDGCDEQCRAELSAAAPNEVEPNDDRVGANVLLLDEAMQRIAVRGRIGGRCDFDNFLLRVPETADVHATLRTSNNQPCGADAPPITLRLLGSDALMLLGEGTARHENACPSISEEDGFAKDLPPGEYYLRVFTGDQEPGFDYSLEVELRFSEEM
jgi:cysteine-rich repeat protein